LGFFVKSTFRSRTDGILAADLTKLLTSSKNLKGDPAPLGLPLSLDLCGQNVKVKIKKIRNCDYCNAARIIAALRAAARGRNAVRICTFAIGGIFTAWVLPPIATVPRNYIVRADGVGAAILSG
jgi:hypothetical protein